MSKLINFLIVFILLFLSACEKEVVIGNDSEAINSIAQEERIQIFIDNGYPSEMKILLNDKEILNIPSFGSESFHTSSGEIKLEAIVNEKSIASVNKTIIKEEKDKKRTPKFLFNPGKKLSYEIAKAKYAILVGGGISSAGQITGEEWISAQYNYFPSEDLPKTSQASTEHSKLYRTVTSESSPELALHALNSLKSPLYWQDSLPMAALKVAEYKDTEASEKALLNCLDSKVDNKEFFENVAQTLSTIIQEENLVKIESLLTEKKNINYLRKPLLSILLHKMKSEFIISLLTNQSISYSDLNTVLKTLPDSLRKQAFLDLLKYTDSAQSRTLNSAIIIEDLNDEKFIAEISRITQSEDKARLADSLIATMKNAYPRKTLNEKQISVMINFVFSSKNSKEEIALIDRLFNEKNYEVIVSYLPDLEPYSIEKLFRLLRESRYKETDFPEMFVNWALDSKNEKVLEQAISTIKSHKKWLDSDIGNKIKNIIIGSTASDANRELSNFYINHKLSANNDYSAQKEFIIELLPNMYKNSISQVVSIMAGKDETSALQDLIENYPKIKLPETKVEIIRNLYRFRKSKDASKGFLSTALKDKSPEVSTAAFSALLSALSNEKKDIKEKYNSQLLAIVQNEQNPELKLSLNKEYTKWRLRSLASDYRRDPQAGEEALAFLKKNKEDKELSTLATRALTNSSSEELVNQLIPLIPQLHLDAQKIVSVSHVQIFSGLKNAPLQLQFYSMLLTSNDPDIRKDSFRNLLYASKRNQIDKTEAEKALKNTLSKEKDPKAKTYMETTFYRDKIRDLKSAISKEPSKSEEAFQYLKDFPNNEDIVKDAISCLTRAKNKNIASFLNTNFQIFSPDSLQEICQLLYLDLRKGNKEYLSFYSSALKSKNEKLRQTAFEKLSYSISSTNPLNSEIKNLLEKAISIESNEAIKKKMTERFKRIK